ncbi:unnamed protein product [Arabidopsis lyrata]|nr:unnamed protein product [Arabidopsis lyrata]
MKAAVALGNMRHKRELLGLTHHRSYCPYLLIPRHSPEGPDRSVNGRHEVMDEMNRSDLNSQSQLSDSSLASPISQPPQMSTPPADYDDMSEALPSFHGSSADDTDVFTVPGPRSCHRRRHLSEHSHSSLHSDGCVPSMGFTNLEPGESSKRKGSSVSPPVSDQRMKKKYPGIIITESQLPPKKR